MRIAILSAALLALTGCSDLTTINPDGRCGNGVIEPTNNEDCEPGKALPGDRECGIVGALNACRLVCDTEPDGPRCPKGWGCGIDGICRSPAGALNGVNIIRTIRTPIGFGDVDGNGYPDLVSVQTPRLLVGYGNDEANYESILDVPVTASPKEPVVADGDNDGVDDIAVVAGNNISIFFGETDQSLDPLMVPTQLLGFEPFALRVTAMRAGDIRGVQLPVTVVDDYERLAVVLLGGESFADVPEAEFAESGADDFDVDPLLDHYAVGDLIVRGAEFERDEIAVGVFRGDFVSIYTLGCALIGESAEVDTNDCEFIEGPEIDTPPGYQLSADGTFFGDIDGDGLSDVIFGVGGPGGRTAAYALQTAPGEFGPAQLLDVRFAAAGPMGGARPPAELMAVVDMDGDLDAEGRVDLVTVKGIYTAREPVNDAPAFFRGYEPGSTWDQVIVTDTNNDGVPDMVARRDSDLLVLLGVDGINYNLSQTTFPERIDDMLVGDFDGDLFTDVIVRSQQRLSIGFNDGRGLPEAFEDVVNDLGRITPTALRSIDEDAIDDIAMLVRPADGEALPAYLLNLRGNGTRRLSAPITITGQADGLGFMDTPQGPVGVATELSADESTWKLRRVDQSSVIQDLLFEPEPLELGDGCFFDPTLTYSLTAIEVDGDETEELVAIESYRSENLMGELALLTPAILDLTSATSLDCTRLDPTPPEIEGQLIASQVIDIDGDGHTDIAAGFTGVRLFDGDPERTDGGVVIWWGLEGGFAAPVGIPELAEPSRFGGAFAFGEFDGTDGLELIVIRDRYPEVFDIDVETKEATLVGTLDNVRFEREDFDRIEVIDLNRDGTDDIVLASAEQTTVLLQRECAPADAADDRCTRSNPRE